MTHDGQSVDSKSRGGQAEPAQQPSAASPRDELDGLFADVDGLLARERGVRAWLCERPTWLRNALALAASVGLVAAVAVIPRGSDSKPWTALQLGSSLALQTAILAALIARVLRPLQKTDVPSSMSFYALAATGLLTPAVLALWPSNPELMHRAPMDCLAIGLGVGLLLIALLRGLDRAEHAERETIVLASAAAGMAANLALMFHCTHAPIQHALGVHAPLGLLLWLGYRAVGAMRARRG